METKQLLDSIENRITLLRKRILEINKDKRLNFANKAKLAKLAEKTK